MKKYWWLILMTVMMAVAMLVPATASAVVISSRGGWVDCFSEMDTKTYLYGVRVPEQEAELLEGGWFKADTAHGKVYVRASDVSRIQVETPATEAPPPLRPGVTPVPREDVVTGVKDPTFTGTNISYTVPSGGLWLYKKPVSGTSPVDSVKAGTKVTLTQPNKDVDPDNYIAGWYSVYYNNDTYFVPIEGISLSSTPSTTELGAVQSVVIKGNPNVDDPVKLYSGYKLSTTSPVTASIDTSTVVSDTLVPGSHINARYFRDGIYSCEMGGRPLYFDESCIDKKSTATVTSNDGVSLMTYIQLKKDPPDPAANNDPKLYTSMSKTDATRYAIVDITNTKGLYGVKVSSDWYKVQYGPDVLYLPAVFAGTTTQVADNNTAATGTYYVTVGSKTAYIYERTTLGNDGRPAASNNISPGSTITPNPTAGTLSPGQRVLASPFNSNWYTYIHDGKTCYIFAGDLADFVSSTQTSGLKVYLSGVYLYSKPSDNPDNNIESGTSYKTDILIPIGYYTVQNYNDVWYSIIYGNATYYVKKNSTPATVRQITVGSAGLGAFRNILGALPVVPPIPAGTILTLTPAVIDRRVDPPITDRGLLSGWFSTIYNGQEYLVASSDINAPNSLARRVTVPPGDKWYVWANDGSSATDWILENTTITITPAATNNYPGGSGVGSSTDTSWYWETTWKGRKWLVDYNLYIDGLGTSPADEDGIPLKEEPIANTVVGKTYNVTIGIQGAMLYEDAACTMPSGHYLMPGEVVRAERHTASIYIVNGSGLKLYLPVGSIASLGRDDANAENLPDDAANYDIRDIVKGEKNSDFTGVVSYRIPAGGLWLYSDPSLGSASRILNAGVTVNLNAYAPDLAWYTTWYGGKQYYVLKDSLDVKTVADTVSSGTYSFVPSSDITLYRTIAFPGTGAAASSIQVADIKLRAGVRVNVTVIKKDANTVSYYQYTHHDGKPYYFPGSTVLPSVFSSALVSSNVGVDVITKVTLKPLTTDRKLYSSPDIRSSSIISEETELFGVSWDQSWYKVIYQNSAWYVRLADIDKTELMAISSGAASTTYTVVIAAGGAKLYSKPSTNTSKTTVDGITYEIGELNRAGQLYGGMTVAASMHSSGWYTYAHSDGKIYYFQNNTTVVSNSNSNEAVRSYQVHLEGPVSLYYTISENAQKSNLYVLLGGYTYTFRTINSVWSSIIVDGQTYYAKNADIAAKEKSNSRTPIASTSIGNTYMITIGGNAIPASYNNAVPVFRSSTLSGEKIGNIATGTKISGTLMYVQQAAAKEVDAAGTITVPTKSNTVNGTGLVYQISLNGVKGYIDASFVSGIASGDEANELRESEQIQSPGGGGSAPIGTTIMKTLNAGTIVYQKMDTSSAPLTISSTMTKEITKENANWYSIKFGETTYYLPASSVETGSNSGGSLAVGEQFTHTFSKAALVYPITDSNSEPVDCILVGETHTIRKINDRWYEVNYKGSMRYILVFDVILPSGYIPDQSGPTINQGSGRTTDGTGIITNTILIDPPTGTVNLRRSASTTATIMARVPKGTELKNLGYAVDANGKVWYKVTYNGVTGYVIGDYVVAVGLVYDSTGGPDGPGGPGGGPTINTADPNQDIGKSLPVNTNAVNIRRGAGSSFELLGTLDKGAIVVPTGYLIGAADGMVWYSFQYKPGIVGYIRADFLSGTSTINELTGNVAIRAGETNLRSGAGDSFSVAAKLPRDMIVTIVGSGKDTAGVVWYRVTVDNLSGYVRSDLVRPLTTAEANALLAAIASQYKQLTAGSKGEEVRRLQQQLINLGYLAAGEADGVYGVKTQNAVKAFQIAKGLGANGIATPQTQAHLFNSTTVTTPGSTKALDWFAEGFKLINANKNIQIYDINSGINWNARYINGDNHADVIPATPEDAAKLKANNITGSYVRRPILVTIAGQKFAGSMYAIGHGTTSYCTYFNGVMCIHFTGSKTHGTGNVDADHQAAINKALQYGN